MKVKLKRGWSKSYPELTAGNVYRVLGIENDSLRIISDAGEPILFHPHAFEYVEPTHPADWVEELGEDGELYAYPPELRDPNSFFERFFDYDMRIRQRLHLYVHRKSHEEAPNLPKPPNSFIRVEWKHDSAEDPITLFSELDDERWEVRKVEVFRDGRIAGAEGRGSTGTTTLNDQPVPSIDELTSNPEFVVTAIARDEFEEIWNKAMDAATL